MDAQTSSSTATPAGDREILTDRDAARLFAASKSRFAEIQREAGFPAPFWLGPRGKRHFRSELLAWAHSRREVQK
jgi:predicted DNA-binding transcriptional regulator AlpA